jgi:hypothetical protein
MPKRHYTLKAEPGRYEVHGSPTSGILGALYTGRSVDVEGGYRDAKKWLDDYETSCGANPTLEHQLLQSLRIAPSSTSCVPLFRGRFFGSPPNSSQDFGPPSPAHACRGRYNGKAVPALYLCSSVTGVKKELGAPPPGYTLWTQRFQISPEIRMADARELAIDSFAAAVFWLIESGRDRLLAPPQLGQRIGQLIGAEYDGLLVPGVRGEPNQLYWNAVVFRPEDRWLRFVQRSAQPEEAS